VSRALLEKRVVPQPVKKYAAFYGTGEVHYRVLNSRTFFPILSQINPIDALPTDFFSLRYYFVRAL
jgi:hypothetical protein